MIRDSNEISDLVSGVTLDLFKAEPGTTVTLEIEPDLTAVRQAITEFVDSFNAARTFLREQQSVNSEGEVAETALLFGDPIVRSLTTDLGNEISTLVDGIKAGNFTNLRDIGIELDANNLLTIDDGELDAALVDNVDQVRTLFEFGFQADSPNVSLVGRNGRFDLGTFTIDTPAGAIDGTNVQVGGVDAFEVDGNILRGLAGTVYEGLSIAYTRDTSDPAAAAESITITTTLGIAERLFQTVEEYASPVDGLITDQVNRIEAQSSDFRDEIADIDARLALVREALIKEFAALEQAIAQANAVSDQLKAFIEASNKN